ncbi:DNA circularization protein [Laribacter hongkongensis]|uniref:DNA circularization protein n=1 Tax=Laribacter hongkongensis TaxID=168471 RepID=UPI0018776090|nr:DNA circularization N-terminal domain-containing protein [Laribacter hongkongensis]
MGWRERLRPASFRGVSFFVESADGECGRRIQVNEYPQRDEPLIEDLGGRAVGHKVAGFLVGRNCLDERDKLLEALNTAGAGELVHPWIGSLTVRIGKVSHSYARTDGGLVRFDFECWPSVEVVYPSASLNSAKQLDQKAGALADGLGERFGAAMQSLAGAKLYADEMMAQASSMLAPVQSSLGDVLSLVGGVRGLVSGVVNGVDGMAGQLMGAFDQLRLPFGSLGFASLASLIGSRSQAAGALAGHRPVVSPAVSATPTGQAASAVVDLVQGALIVDAARLAASAPVTRPPPPVQTAALPLQLVTTARPADVPVADDVLAARDALADAIWTVSVTAPHVLYPLLSDVRHAASAHLVEVARQGVALRSYTPPGIMPALVLAYRELGDARRADEIVIRNRIAHPGFVPVQSLQLLSR